MLLPGNKTLRKMTADAQAQLDAQIDWLRYAEDLMQSTPAEEPEALSNKDEARIMVKDAQEFRDGILPKWQSEANRILGHVGICPSPSDC